MTNARFAFWAEDLAGKLDLSTAGTNTLDAAARRTTGTNPAEIALWAVFNSNAVSAAASGGAGNDLISARSNILTPATARLASTTVTTNMLAEFAANLRSEDEPEVIPFGFGYPDAGKAKINLNANLAAGSVATLAAAITKNLPNFSQRSGAMNSTAYVNGVAASIIDYADTDANPTVDSAANPSYFGIENIPWPNELFDRILFTSVTDGGLIRVELKDWIEVWNMGNKSTAAATVTISNSYDMVLTFTNPTLRASFKGNLKDAKFESGQIGSRDFSVPALQPNEYAVVDSITTSASRRLAWQIPNASWVTTNSAVKGSWAIFADSADETKNMTFKAYVGSTMIQQSQGGRWPRYLSVASRMVPSPGTPSRFIFANPVGFASQTAASSASATPAHSGGDPRAQLFLTDPLRSQNYTNKYSSPGGRNWEKYWVDQSRFPESEVNPKLLWPDSGHTNSADRGGTPTSYSDNPDIFARASITNNFVMRRNDTGSYTNILELGNIYDPMQWGDSTALPPGVSGQPGMWTNLTTAAAPNARFGGRNTLRIGRWEFTKFTNNGTRASQLLDIFAVGPAGGSGAVLNPVRGRININTASTNVLRALAAGVAHASDPALLPGGTNFYATNTAVSGFVSGVTNRRSQKPFFSTSELNTITNTNASVWPGNAVFGNSNLAGVSEWNDGAAEEWFAKVYPLSSVRSRNFVVYAVGQALRPGTTNDVLSTAKAMYQIYLKPVRNTADGLTTNSTSEVVQSWSL
ncbi:MAG: hypothetical protein JHC85_09485 [Chthoniobacterales bacterium]|nr:hypothetical protein [Chthoniobacterales bacterium]